MSALAALTKGANLAAMTETLTARDARSEARAAVAADADRAAETLAKAFADDPLMCFLLPERGQRARRRCPGCSSCCSSSACRMAACDVTSGYESDAHW